MACNVCLNKVCAVARECGGGEKVNRRKEAELELEHLKYQQEVEKLRYEMLKSKQLEAQKLQHDLKNCILVLKQMDK